MDDSKCPGNNLAISPDDVSRIKIRIDAGRYQSMKPMIGKSIDQSMIIDALLVNWHRLASANR